MPPALQVAASASADQLLVDLGTSPDGLTSSEATQRLRDIGRNEAVPDLRLHVALDLLKRLLSPLTLMLLALACVSALIGDYKSAAVTASMVVLSVGLATVQERRATRAAAALKALVHTTTSVKRRVSAGLRPEITEIPLVELVPGDIVHLGAGDIVPADIRLLFTKNLFVNQAAMTGESVPSEKHASPLTAINSGAPGDIENVALMGTSVVSGTGFGVVILTGPRSIFGHISQQVTDATPPTSFGRGLRRVARVMLTLIVVMAPTVFLINFWTKGALVEALMFSLAVAVGLTPEMLPMIVTVTLSKGALALARRKVIVKELNAIQNLGAMDILCTDKTGTLTQDCVILRRHVDLVGNDSNSVLRLTYLNSFFQTGLRNLLDVAVLHADDTSLVGVEARTRYRLIDEIPFDFARRRMSVVIESERDRLLICKGAIEEVLDSCSDYEIDGRLVSLSDDRLQEARRFTQRLNDDGYRLLAVAYKTLVPSGSISYDVTDERSLTLAGFVAFIDPPKDSAAAALRLLHSSGVTVKVLTGDSPAIAGHICNLVGLSFDSVVIGHELDQLEPQALTELAEQATVFAKLTPDHKAAIVRALRSRGHVVGVLGDGINDSPALRAADVGISVDTGTDIAKESAHIILLEKSLLVLHDGVIEGRRVFANLVKYLRMATSSNFGNVFSVLGTSIWLPFLPMAPIQILACNLLYDVSQASIPADNVDEDATIAPGIWNIRSLWRYIALMGPLSSAFDYVTFALLYGVLHLSTPHDARTFQSAWFLESILSQILVIYIIRTRKIPLIESRPANAVVLTTMVVIFVALWLPFSPLAAPLQLVPPTPQFWYYLPAILAAYLLSAYFVRSWLHPGMQGPPSHSTGLPLVCATSKGGS
ncbi:magnesium-translocating P-type ATPase [Cupriavidus pauculus]|uniref:magnesium-translocating P-type ATPase n=1 Tax=Cupriavidus pauculus TaxID=82633 RepID=UPI000A0662D8|nr:magnesium-translocating P-type ATPase [Cupriavidus pauculus]